MAGETGTGEKPTEDRATGEERQRYQDVTVHALSLIHIFNVYKRSDLDGEGKEYPILHMQL